MKTKAKVYKKLTTESKTKECRKLNTKTKAKTHILRQVLAHVVRALGLKGQALRAFCRLKHLLGSLAVLPRPPIDNASSSFRILDRVPVSFNTHGQ